MTVFQSPPGKWRAKFVHKGRQVWVKGGPWPTKKEAQAAERTYRDKLEHRQSTETCESFAARWLEEWPRPAEATRRTYIAAADRFADHFKDTPLADIQHIQARTWALSVPRGISRVIRIMYGDARNAGLVDHNPFDRLRLPPTERKVDVRPPTMNEYRTLLDACHILEGYGPEFRAMIQFSAWTGVRAGELHGLCWEDVQGDTIWIRRSRKRDGAMGPPKNSHERMIAFLPPAKVLDDLPRRPDPFVFHSPRGNPLVQGSHFYAWRVVRAEAGLKDLRWHGLRHFCATQLLELGMSHFDVSVQLGHRDGGALVMERYGHPSEDAARKRLLGAFEFSADEIGSRAVGEAS